MGFDPKYQRWSIGSFLLMHFIEQTYRHFGEIGEIDFGPGNHRYKREICNHQFIEASVTIFAPRLKWMAVNLLRTTLAWTRQTAIRILGDSELRDPFVRAWRRTLLAKRALTGRMTS